MTALAVDSRSCAWCRGPISESMRADAVCCSTRCRQARHRFISGVGAPDPSFVDELRIRIAYADPPYPGKSKKYYGEHPDYAGEVDHEALIRDLAKYDGWALSTSAAALPTVLASCPPGVRVAAWHRGPRMDNRPIVHNAWEPVIYWGGRRSFTRRVEQLDASAAALRDASSAAAVERDPSRVATVERDASRSTSSATHQLSRHTGETRRVDSLVYGAHPRTTDPQRVIGAKPAIFCRWIFDLLGAQPHDEFTDIFPGSGGVQRAWDAYATTNDRSLRV